ncbi:MAG: EamA family transporter, partial [Bacillaceae bacterium]|nr:EamA family transporter [Bacillaceae bacterium]
MCAIKLAIFIYNMTYPIFVTIFARFILKDKFTLKKSVAVIIAFIGIILVSDFNFGDMGRVGVWGVFLCGGGGGWGGGGGGGGGWGVGGGGG